MKKVHPIWPAVIWFVFTTILLTLPGSTIPKDDWFDFLWVDKWVHIILFSVLTFLFARVSFYRVATSFRKSLIAVTFIFSFYGLIMEFIQKWFIANRSFDYGDVLADMIGCALGCWIASLFMTKSKSNA